jgi:hypothetical protein
MSAANYDVSISCGEDSSFTLRIVDAFQDPVDFSGSSFVAEIREAHKKPLIAAFTITDIGDGTLRFVLPSAQSKLISPTKSYKWDFFWTQSDGTVTKVLYGDVTSTHNISKI